MRILIVVLSVLTCLMPWRTALAGDGLPDRAEITTADKPQVI